MSFATFINLSILFKLVSYLTANEFIKGHLNGQHAKIDERCAGRNQYIFLAKGRRGR
jgi:hypothetical protein